MLHFGLCIAAYIIIRYISIHVTKTVMRRRFRAEFRKNYKVVRGNKNSSLP